MKTAEQFVEEFDFSCGDISPYAKAKLNKLFQEAIAEARKQALEEMETSFRRTFQKHFANNGRRLLPQVVDVCELELLNKTLSAIRQLADKVEA